MSLDFYIYAMQRVDVFSSNVTHNLGKMATEAGLYKCLWLPEESGFKKAGELIPVLETGLEALKANPEKYKAYNPTNGWGSYDFFVNFVAGVLAACREYPDGEIYACR